MTALFSEDIWFVFNETCCSVRNDYSPRRDGESEEISFEFCKMKSVLDQVRSLEIKGIARVL